MATKVYPTVPGTHTPEMLRSKVRDSLTALNTEDVDIFYLHAADRSVPFVDTLQTVNELYKEGRFKTLGLSNYTAYEVAEIVTLCKERGWVRPKIYQVRDTMAPPDRREIRECQLKSRRDDRQCTTQSQGQLKKSLSPPVGNMA